MVPTRIEDLKPMQIGRPYVIVRKEQIGKKKYGIAVKESGAQIVILDGLSESIIENCDGRKTIADISNQFGMDSNKVIEIMRNLESKELVLFEQVEQKIKKINNPPNNRTEKIIDMLAIKSGNNMLETPYNVSLVVTLRCNGGCKYCFAEPSPKIDEMPVENYYRMIEEMNLLGVRKIIFTGGEPFLYPNFIDVIKFASKYKFFIEIVTNGTMITPKVASDLAEILKEIPHVVQISVDSYISERHEDMRPGCKLVKVLESIRLLSSEGVCVAVNSVATKYNLLDLEGTHDAVKLAGAHVYRILPLRCLGKGRGLRHICIGDKERTEMKNIVKSIASKPGSIIVDETREPPYKDKNIKPSENRKRYWTCDAGTTEITILPDGRIIPCAFFVTHPEYIGESVIDKGIHWTWKNSKILESFRWLEFKNTKCNYCEYSEYCNGGCPLDRYELTGSLSLPDPNCPYTPNEIKGSLQSARSPPHLSGINYESNTNQTGGVSSTRGQRR